MANGRNNAALTEFLREHYTTSRDQAAALAAYVLGGRGSEPVGAAPQGRGQKPAAERAEREPSTPEEPKPSKRQARQPKPDEGARTEAKSDAKPETKPEIELGPGDRRPTVRGRRREPKPPLLQPESAGVARAPVPAVTEPSPVAPPSEEARPAPTPETATPGDAASGENAPVPRDNIPD